MLEELRILNFKVWDKALWNHPLELAPITLLLGSNSAGKTSLLQALLLLKQTFASPDRTLDLNLGGQDQDLVDLGTYQDVVHAHDAEQGLGIALRTSAGLRYEALFTMVGGGPVTQRLVVADDDSAFSATRRSKGGYLLEAPGYEARRVGNRPDARRSFKPERSVAFSPEAVAALRSAGTKVQDLSLGLTKELGSIAYLGPLREPPERTYLWSRQAPNALGERGQFCVAALLASANSRKKRRPRQEGGRGWLVEQVSSWLKRLGIADSLDIVRQGRSRFFEVMVKTDGQKANIVDVGFGVSQVLPFVVLAYFVPRGTTILAEQPEIHLHPSVQSGLANLMAEVARQRKVQFLVETHSEHLFRRMQVLVADEKLDTADCRLYFVRARGGTACLEPLRMDEYGRIANWPERFFGDAVGETERQMRRAFERLRNQRA